MNFTSSVFSRKNTRVYIIKGSTPKGVNHSANGKVMYKFSPNNLVVYCPDKSIKTGLLWCLTFADCRPQTADCRLQTADCRLQTPDCRLQTGVYRLQTIDYILYTV